jgi:polyisoprenoid-binding protein YceI
MIRGSLKFVGVSLVWAVLLASSGCEQKKSADLAPASSALAPAKPTSQGARRFKLDPAQSKVDFTMDAELEKISGRAPSALEGDVFVDLKDIGKSSGFLKLDLDKLSIYQKKRTKADGEFGEETRNEKQNADMRVWFEIAEDAPADVREKNRWVEFKLSKVTAPSVNDLSAQTGADRTLTATVGGDFRLHGRTKEHSAKVEVTVHYEGDEAKSVHVKTLEPLAVGLEEHDVRPRSAFSKLADKTLDTLGAKVAKVAKVSLDFTAHAAP